MKLLAIVIAILLGGHIIEAQQTWFIPDRQQQVQPKGENSEEVVIRALQSVLPKQRIAIRIYVHGPCQMDPSKGIPFPAIDTQPPRGGEVGFGAVRDIFRNDKNVTVTQDGSSVIRIVIGNVFTSFLNTELASVHLNKTAQYNPDGPAGAIDSIESQPTVEKAMHELRVSRQPVFYIGLVVPFLTSLPHLPSSLKHMTVDQSLDLIAKTFPGVVVYGECDDTDGSHHVDIRFDWFKNMPRTGAVGGVASAERCVRVAQPRNIARIENSSILALASAFDI
ncbi:MAG TPA: hypothetical protein VN862_07350 [Candidatus Acidoferrales bacterium]|nr:hypothetical protein [Candidatus Acidoferrales bacterium]